MIVQTNKPYGYAEMMTDFQKLLERFPFLETRIIGYSVLGKAIPAVRIGTGKTIIHYNGACHANEWITSLLLMKFVEDCAYALESSTRLAQDQRSELQCQSQQEEQLRDQIGTIEWEELFVGSGGGSGNRDQMGTNEWEELLRSVQLWVVPMVNPDGVELVVKGLGNHHPWYAKLFRWNEGSEDWSGWKANIRGIDLNDQFPAYWEIERERRSTEGPAPKNYPGEKPLSEPEAIALAEWTRRMNFDLVIAFHTQGKEIYWNYRNYEPPQSQEMAERLGKVSGYTPIQLTGSDAGYKDWFIYEFRRPGFTVEAGLGETPLPLQQWDVIYDEVSRLMLEGLYLAHCHD